MKSRGKSYHAWLLTSAAATAIAWAGSAAAEDAKFDIAPQPLASALNEFSLQSKQSVLFTTDLAQSKASQGVSGQVEVADALSSLLAGTGLTYRRNGNTFLIMSASDPQSGSAAGDGADGTVQALIVTAQKREENIQDVPIAMSAFSQEDLTRSQVAGGPDLMTQVPNFTFTKTNFSGYSIQIRGIGTQAISATTDAAVAVAFNNTPFIRNRFFEQEFYDLQRVEVLRGPQGTLYGRNATAGVVNIITAKPSFREEARLSVDVGNYNSNRLEGMLNLPLVDDKVALRVAGAWTKRDGYDTNQITGNQIDGRDLWSTRTSLRIAPTDKIEANLVWEHFEENDDRLRSAKQLCHTHEVTNISGQFPDGTPFSFDTTHYQRLPDPGQGGGVWSGVQATFSQGCLAASLYAPESFETPNGISLPYYVPLAQEGLPIAGDPAHPIDPYLSRTQSRDLRTIESTVDPHYRAKNDTVELQGKFDLSDNLSLTSETAWASDFIFSTEDFNRFNTTPGAFSGQDNGIFGILHQRGILDSNGVYCDPQIGCADRLVAIDLSTAKSRQFSQELRLASDFDGPFNFSLGANFLRYDTMEKYYVFINSVSMMAAISTHGGGNVPGALGPWIPGITDNSDCLKRGLVPPDPAHAQPILACTYVDPNPISNLNDLGHNYFLSKNPYKLLSYAAFGEAYYRITPSLKLTAGLRWTVDKKEAPRIPSWLLASDTAGYPVAEVVRQEWREPTGRLTLDWKPDLSFTDETLLYASFAHGYKAGGANPPPYGIAVYHNGDGPGLMDETAARPKTFKPEFVNAYEIGAKNTLFDGRLTLNATAFYYDYTGYQISQIVDRSAANYNFDAKIWGLELESDWRPLENLRLGLKLGYEKTRVGDGMKAIDIMDRTAGHEGWVVVRPFPSIPSNCILPAWLFVGNAGTYSNNTVGLIQLGSPSGGGNSACEIAYVFNLDPVTGMSYVANPTQYDSSQGGTLNWHPNYPGWDPASAPNHGEGFYKGLSGHELPNAPHITATVTADYTLPLANDWLMTLHGDFYYQSEAWTRIFNTPGYDKLKAYNNVNFAAIFANEDAGWKVMAYVKNVFDEDNITGAFLNSDDTGLTTNVFLNEPRLYGLRITKDWTGQGWWTGANPNHLASEPYPLTVEVAGMVQRQDAPYSTLSPDVADAFAAAIDPRTAQHRDLDWGDGREVKLTYRPAAGPWAISGSVRYGKTNSGTTRLHQSQLALVSCAVGYPFAYVCSPDVGNGSALKYVYNWSDTAVSTREKHEIADFRVGHDVGLGVLGAGNSTLSAGLRYASFRSDTDVSMSGIPDAYAPAYWSHFKYSHFSRYSANMSAHREFKGAGPTLSWEAGKRLIGNEQVGHVDLDWALTGGVLFGKQKTEIKGSETSGYWAGQYQYIHVPLTNVVTTSLDRAPRSKSVSVPVADVSLGLSYEIQRMKVSTGYRWERYFNVLDVGQDEAKKADRTIDGPYFKIAVGFGG